MELICFSKEVCVTINQSTPLKCVSQRVCCSVWMHVQVILSEWGIGHRCDEHVCVFRGWDGSECVYVCVCACACVYQCVCDSSEFVFVNPTV